MTSALMTLPLMTLRLMTLGIAAMLGNVILSGMAGDDSKKGSAGCLERA